MLPVTPPADAGANCTEKDTLAPGLTVCGTVRPLRLNPLPLTVACEMVRAALPELLSETV
jgi:hypothetical protein